MMASEVNALLNLVVNLTSFASQIQERWYKGSAQLASVQNKVWVLSSKQAHWSEQLQRYGIDEDKHLLRLVQAAEKALAEQEQSLRKLQKSPFRRFQKRLFPEQLSYFLDEILKIVNSGPQLLESRVANIDLLDRYSAQSPAPLPFGPDPNYVPIPDSILAVQNALEQADGPRVVTVYGGPGMGKSSLLKYLGVHYQEEQKRRPDSPFPHGVYYLYCGQDAVKRVKQLQLDLLGTLGFGTESGTPPDDLQEGDYIVLSSNHKKLRSRLAKQKLLIMLDDLWEATVLQDLVVPAEGIKYLVTSQRSDVYHFAETVQIKRPSLSESIQILANYTKGLPKKGELPHNVQIVAQDIIKTVEYHPLALANIGMSINRRQATDVEQWGMIRKHIYNHLDEKDRSPPAFERPYSLPVSASMMLMVESLPPEARQLLFVVALLQGGRQLPEPLVQYFYSYVQPNNFRLMYNNLEKDLEDRSLIDVTTQGNRSTLDAHGLRMHYILEHKKPEVRAIALQILASNGGQGVGELSKRGDAEEKLVAILSAMYYHPSVKDVLVGTSGNHGVIPRNLNLETYELDLVESARTKHYDIQDLVWFLNADHEAATWKRQAHESAKKIIIKFICQGKLADEDMACLLQIPQATSTACRRLGFFLGFLWEDFVMHNVTFSAAHGQTMQILLDLFHNNTILVERRADVTCALLHVLHLESIDAILDFSAKYASLFAMESNRDLQNAVMLGLASFLWAGGGFHITDRGIATMAKPSGLLDSVEAVLVSGNDLGLRQSALNIIHNFSLNREMARQIGSRPVTLDKVCQMLLSDESSDSETRIAGWTLSALLETPEIRVKLGAIGGIWDGLGSILTNLEDSWLASPARGTRAVLKERARMVARTLGQLAFEKNLRPIIAALPGIKEGLLFLQRLEMASKAAFGPFESAWVQNSSTLTLTVLYPQELTTPKSGDLPLVGYYDDPSTAMSCSLENFDYFGFYWARVCAYIQIQFYAEALKNLDVAQYFADLFRNLHLQHSHRDVYYGMAHRWYTPGIFEDNLRDCRIFLQAMVEDYAGALEGANKRLEPIADCDEAWYRVERGVLKRLSGDLQGALDDLNKAVVLGKDFFNTDVFWRRSNRGDILWQRGYVRYLMDDKIGAKDDAELAKKEMNCMLFIDKLFMEREDLWQLRRIPVKYMGHLL